MTENIIFSRGNLLEVQVTKELFSLLRPCCFFFHSGQKKKNAPETLPLLLNAVQFVWSGFLNTTFQTILITHKAFVFVYVERRRALIGPQRKHQDVIVLRVSQSFSLFFFLKPCCVYVRTPLR